MTEEQKQKMATELAQLAWDSLEPRPEIRNMDSLVLHMTKLVHEAEKLITVDSAQILRADYESYQKDNPDSNFQDFETAAIREVCASLAKEFCLGLLRQNLTLQ
jgi:hypothetical protein